MENKNTFTNQGSRKKEVVLTKLKLLKGERILLIDN